MRLSNTSTEELALSHYNLSFLIFFTFSQKLSGSLFFFFKKSWPTQSSVLVVFLKQSVRFQNLSDMAELSDPNVIYGGDIDESDVSVNNYSSLGGQIISDLQQGGDKPAFVRSN